MSPNLLTTKLYTPPTRKNLVPRPRLIRLLDEAWQEGIKLTLVSAPAGYGKTTLVTEWLSGLQIQSTWLSLDKNDNDPARFLAYLIAALQNVDPDIGQAAQAMMQSPQPPPPDVFLTALVNDLASIPPPFILVLDDYHVVQSMSVHQQLGFLVEHKPPQMHLVLITREDPPLPLALLRARGQIVEIRQKDLRFSLEESADFLKRIMGLNLTLNDIAALEQRTEGWIAGLQLASLSMQGSDYLPDFIQAFSGSSHFVLDFLIEEVFERQPSEVQEFLLKTSILDSLSVPLCEAVSERSDGQRLLLGLERANLFVIPLDQQRVWYRYHHLFAELLRHKLHNSGVYSESLLHRRASQWYEANGFMSEAVQHALIAQDWESAGRVIERAAAGAVRNGQLATLHGWLIALPESVVRDSLELTTTIGWVSLMMGQFETAGAYAELAEGLLSVDAPRGSQASLKALNASFALARQDIPNTIEMSQEVLELVEEPDPYNLRGMALNNLAQAHMLVGNLPAAIATFREMVSMSQKAGHSPITISAMANLAALLHQGGKRREAVVLCQQALDECVDALGRPLPLAGYAHAAMGILFYEANDLVPARQHLLQAMEHGKQLGLATGVATSGGVALAQLQWAAGEGEAALKTLTGIRQLALQNNLGHVDFMIAAVEADILLKQGNIEVATRWAENTGLSPFDTPNPLREGDYFIYARLLLAQNRLDEVDTLLANFENFAREGGRQRSLLTIYILQALVHQACGNVKSALAFLERALRMAAPEGYRRAFLDEGQALVDLLPKVRHLSPTFVDQLLEDAQAELGIRIPSAIAQPLVEPLSDRELDVLELVAEGMTNSEIAHQLVISVGTTKSHVHSILSKLGVSNRTQAVAQARELGLL
ncbi:MAG TPA: LuxR C-terminal-related transcriptional regulator [Anaerolineales bacterium]|nr:LuxR C-terminal-related transcriptional regulator [Anaerolineales bacterium]